MLVMPVILETPGLILRRFNLADAPFIVQLLNSPNWLQHIGNRHIKTLADAQSYLVNGPIMSYAVYGFGLYLVALKDTGTPIGMCGLLKRDYLDDVDIGYALLPEYEGKGYAYEIVSATVEHAFESQPLRRISAITDVANLRSIQLLKKMGFIFRNMISPDGGKELMLFVKDKDDLL